MKISPSENDFIDIHSHLLDNEKNVFRILNTSTIDIPSFLSDQPVSVGLHPWHINDSAIEALPGILVNSLELPQVKAVGETGLDRFIKTDMEKQTEVFAIHIKFALEYNKPLIIHCVRAYSELINLKNKYGSKVKWIIHGFNGNENSAEELVSKGFYIFLGFRLLKNEEKVLSLMKYLKQDRIFIETDEDNIPVKDLYSKVAELYQTDLVSLHKIIRNNYQEAFNE